MAGIREIHKNKNPGGLAGIYYHYIIHLTYISFINIIFVFSNNNLPVDFLYQIFKLALIRVKLLSKIIQILNTSFK